MHHPSRRSTIIGLGLGVAGAFAGSSAANAAPKAKTASSGTPSSVSHPLRFGISNQGGPLGSRELDRVASLTKEAPKLILFFKDFRQAPPITELNAVLTRGAVPILTWEPWVAGGGLNQHGYSLAAIAGGAHDGYIKSWGAALANWGQPVLLRFAHEMNGDWYPWSEAVNGNNPGDYVRAWRHVHDVLLAEGAGNVRWVWAPNAGGPVDMAGLYPGDTYVDVLGLDGYNWGTVGSSWGSRWTPAGGLFGPWLDRLRVLGSGKEIIISETACTELGGNKAEWIRDAIAYLDAQPDVTGFIWFDMNKETDWRVASSTASSTSFAAALAARE